MLHNLGEGIARNVESEFESGSAVEAESEEEVVEEVVAMEVVTETQAKIMIG